MIYEHRCAKCGHHSFDTELLKVCPECASNEITNVTETNNEEKKHEHPNDDN